MKVLVTGHHGYIGSVVAPFLAGKGHDVTGLDTFFYRDCDLRPGPQVESVQRDVRDLGEADLQGYDAVVHLAALSNDPLGSLAPDLTYDINHRASVRLALMARDAGVRRFLYASTCSVYGASGGDDLVDEDAPLRPVTPYAESKVRVEDDVEALADADFTPVFMRNATAFGFSPRLRADIVLNNLVGHAYLSGEVKVLSDGTPWRPLVHALDIAEAFTHVLEAPREAVHNRAFNVGTERNNVTVAEIAGEVVEAVPGSELRITGEAGADPRSYRVNFARLRAALPEFDCRWTVKDGAIELVEAYRAYGLTRSDFDHRFTRLARLSDRRMMGTIDQTLRP